MEQLGITIVDWGRLVYDMVNGNVEVPGGTLKYFQPTFIVSQTEKDGYHPNLLTGYIATLMTYCAVTGESAVGQPYAFCNDTALNSTFDFDAFCKKYYTYGGTKTNFPEVFQSEADMKGIQQLVDQYLAEKAYLNG